MQKIAVLLSGSGRTLDNFHEGIQAGTMKAEIQVVVSNVGDALGLEKAQKYGYPAVHAADNSAINTILAEYDIDLVILAGYLKLYEPPEQLKQRVVNIHPSLIPSFCGPGFTDIMSMRPSKPEAVPSAAVLSILQTKSTMKVLLSCKNAFV